MNKNGKRAREQKGGKCTRTKIKKIKRTKSQTESKIRTRII